MKMSGENKIALITGATGYIGHQLAMRLIKEKWQVHIIVRSTSNTKKILNQSNYKINIHIHYEGNTLNQIIQLIRPTIVFHLASFVLVNHQYEDIAPMINSNIKFGVQLLEAMIKNKVFHLINTGTFWQNYNNAAYSPVNLYAASKQAFEVMMQYYQETSSLKVITLKLFDTYGPEDTRPKLFTLLERATKTGEKLLMSKGEQKIDLVYIDDVTKAFILSANYLLNEKQDYTGTYVISSGSSILLKDVVKQYEEIRGKKLNIEWGGRPYREREVMVPWDEGKKLKNWKAEISLKAGIQKILNCNNIPMGG